MESKTIIQNNKLYWVYLVGFFIILTLPLLNLPPWFSPPDWGKTIVFRIILSVLIFLFLCQLLFQWDKISTIVGILSSRKNKVFWPFWILVALLGVYFLATIFSKDILFSLWGNPYRSGGFVNFAFYIIFAILAFLIVRPKDWQKIWNFSLLIGALVLIIALLQKFKILSKFFVLAIGGRSHSTIGGPIFLGIYLALLSFLALSFIIKTKNIIKRVLYLSFFLLSIFTAILIAQSRAATMGITAGFLFFLFFYPFKRPRLSIILKIIALVVLFLGILGLIFLNKHPEVYQNQSRLIKDPLVRILTISKGLKADESRISAWQVSSNAVKNRPIFGYGPENFNIGFDKYYDPSLTGIERIPEVGVTSWWDRAHNFVFDIAVTAGIPALLIYLTLFGTLFWRLQALKNVQRQSAIISGNQIIIYHGIQATFIGYFVANIFSFDTFSSYLISFLLISYSLNLITQSENHPTVEKTTLCKNNAIAQFLHRHKYFFISIFFLCLVWFIWVYNIKPFQINTQINVAKYLVGDKKCEAAFSRMDKILEKKSFLDSYLRLKYIDYLRACEAQHPEKTYDYAQKGAKLLKENTAIQPYNVRNWILLAGFMNVLIDKEQNQQNWEKLVSDTKSYLEKAEELSPKRQEVLLEWTKFSLVANNYQLMKEKSQKCIDVNPELADCYWFKGLAEIFLGDLEKGEKNIAMAQERGYNGDNLISLIQLAKAHTIAKNFKELAEVYQRLIALKPQEPQYHATLAFVYKELKDYKKAREEAMKVLELQPEAKEMVEEFLKTLY